MSESSVQPIDNRSRTKIVSTVGPACRDPEMLMKLIAAGVDVFRINMAHSTPEKSDALMRDIRGVSQAAKRPIGVLVDLAGPKIRLGQLHTDPSECLRGETYHFVRGTPKSKNELVSTYIPLVDELDVDDRVMLADGTVSMIVTDKNEHQVQCRVVGPGVIRSKQGINLPGAKLSVPAMSEEDLANAEWAAQNGADFISLSFVRSAREIRQLKEIVSSHGSVAKVIAKIEKPEALERLDEIVLASDGIMVARGDLGVEIDVAEMPVEQKRIINKCAEHKRPVIVATQMLDSMQRSSRPTRAEATDVANAILDGADACMLSGETAIGQFPCESVEMMNRIMLASERMLEKNWKPQPFQDEPTDDVHPVTAAVVYACGRIAARVNAKMVVIATRSGATALNKAKQRDFIPTVAVSHSEETRRQMTLYWGITPLMHAPERFDSQLIEYIDQWGREEGILQPEDTVVHVFGTGVDQRAHNLVLVHQVS